MKDMELMSVTPAIGSGRARAGSDIRICGVIVGGSLGGQQTIEGAFTTPVAPGPCCARKGSKFMVLVGAFDDALGGAREAAGICWQARYARLGR